MPYVEQCRAAACYNFTTCSSANPNCVCFSTSTGGGVCGLGTVLCSNLTSCNNATLTCSDPQSVCLINTCCFRPICFPLVYAGNSVCPTNSSNGTRTTTVSSTTTSSLINPGVINSTYSSALTNNSPMFARTSGAATFFYAAIRLTLYVTGVYTITSNSSMDAYGYLYANSFNASNVNYNLMAGDDDSNGAVQFRIVVNLQANINYILVFTTFSERVTGSFSVIVSGPYTVNLVPINSMTSTSPTTTTQQTSTIQSTILPTNRSCLVWNQIPINVAGNGTSGNTTSMLSQPWDVSIDNNSDLYISDWNNNRIIKFSNGSLLGISLTSGVGSGFSQINMPSASVIDSNGDLYVSDTYNARILKYTNISSLSKSPPITGVIVAGGSWGMGNNQQMFVYGLAVDTLRNVYASDYSANRVMKWTPRATTGIPVAGIGNGTAGNGSNHLFGPLGIFVDQNFALYIADYSNHRIQKWANGSSTGVTVAGSNGQILYPTSVTLDRYGTIYAWANGGLYRFYPGSTFGTNVISSSIWSFGFKFDSVGNVYVADFYHAIKKYTVTGTNCNSRMATVMGNSAKDFSAAYENGQKALKEAVAAIEASRRRSGATLMSN